MEYTFIYRGGFDKKGADFSSFQVENRARQHLYRCKYCIDLLSKRSSGHGSAAAERLRLLKKDKNTFLVAGLLDPCNQCLTHHPRNQ